MTQDEKATCRETGRGPMVQWSAVGYMPLVFWLYCYIHMFSHARVRNCRAPMICSSGVMINHSISRNWGSPRYLTYHRYMTRFYAAAQCSRWVQHPWSELQGTACRCSDLEAPGLQWNCAICRYLLTATSADRDISMLEKSSNTWIDGWK